MNGWRQATLGELADDRSDSIAIGPFGSRMKAECYTASGIPVIRGTNISDTKAWKGEWVYVSEDFADAMPQCIVGAGDLVFPHRGSIGEVGIVRDDVPRYMLSTSLMKFSADRHKADPLFLFYYFRSPVGRHEILKFSSQVGTPGIGQPLTSLRQFRVLLPPIAVQKPIGEILGSLDDKIELNRRMNETLEAIAGAIFKSWFVDFDPVRAKMDGRWRRGQSLPGLPADLYDLFPDGFEDSAFGDIPKGWCTRALRDAFEINPARSLSPGSIAPYLDMANMPAQSPRALHWFDRAFTSGMKFINGDTLVARITPCLENGKTAFVDFLADGQVGWGSTEYIVLRSKSPLPLEYSYFLARSDDFRAHAIANMTGTSGRQRVPVSCFDGYIVVVSSPPVAERFRGFVQPTMATIKQHDEESRTFAAIRDALLPKLMSGGIRLKAAKKTVEATAT